MTPLVPPENVTGAYFTWEFKTRSRMERAFVVRFSSLPTQDDCANLAALITFVTPLHKTLQDFVACDGLADFRDVRIDAKKLLTRIDTFRHTRL
jgi:hypothetical protein